MFSGGSAPAIFHCNCGATEQLGEKGDSAHCGRGPGLKPSLFYWLYAGVETPASLRKNEVPSFSPSCEIVP